MKKIVCVLGLFLFGFTASAKIEMGTPFADGVVLQREMKVPVWGKVVPEMNASLPRSVTVSFAGQTKTVMADSVTGVWKVELDPMDASKESRTMTVTEESGHWLVDLFSSPTDRVEIKDVLVGEVWFCSGQSNTELPLVWDDAHFSDRLGRLTAQMTKKPNIRFCYASDYKWSTTPKTKADYPVAWKPFLPENLEASPSFSAMGVYFALELYSALEIPIGIVGSYWGGTNIDAWTPRCGYEGQEALRETATYKLHDDKSWKDEYKKGPIIDKHQQPTVLWNEMVAPWAPMAMRGFIWYQGCHNNDEGLIYSTKMHALYNGWSKEFKNPNLKIYFVQLAPFGVSWYNLQLAQAKFASEQPNAGMVTTCDIGNLDDIHPNEKSTIGKRLAALALKHDYGFNKMIADAPTLKSCKWEKDRVVLSFENAEGWYLYNSDWSVDVPFEVAGADGKWVKAYLLNANGGAKKTRPWDTRGEVKGVDLVVAADVAVDVTADKRIEKVVEPVKVRYLFQKPWTGGLFAKSGLPLGPFEAAK